MLTVKLLCVGKLKETYFRRAMEEYQKRMQSLCRFQLEEIPEYRLPSQPSDAQIQEGLEKEGALLLKKAQGLCVPLCIEGRLSSSVELSDLLAKAMNHPGRISFFIGSSYGLADSVKHSGPKLSMSPMTFPHALARVMLTEQIYRGLQILGGSKYHK